ncbi:MAG: hypothetical protein IH591_01905 [Bacteroidales bacterium]|nr:hypothetical protein [Bacteroidales bacterium]
MNADRLFKRSLVSLYDFRRRSEFRRKLRAMMNTVGKESGMAAPPADIARAHIALWDRLGSSGGTGWLQLYGNTSGKWDARFIPEPVYYNIIEPCLNEKSFAKAYSDKNFYHRLLPEFDLPRTIAGCTGGVFYSPERKTLSDNQIESLLGSEQSFIVKPSVDSGGGRGVTLWRRSEQGFTSDDGVAFSLPDIKSRCGRNFIIQEVITSHPFYARYNRSSLNTVRMLTYRSVSDNSIHILHSVMRVGASGSITDNQASGGYACTIDNKGALTGRATDKQGKIFSSVNGVDLVPGTMVEGYTVMADAALRIAAAFTHARLLGLDICLDDKGKVRLIEVNCVNNEINFFQIPHGPLFGDFTGEVVEWCSGRKRSFLIDFDI